MLQWTTLNQNFQMNRPAPAQVQPTIHQPPSTFHFAINFSIKAAVGFFAKGASICGLDAGD
jgi:hypothetical protein